MRIAPLIPPALCLLVGFLMGSLPFCVWLPRRLCKVDVCARSSDGNPGTANVFTLCGVPLGILCLLLELGKGIVPLLCAKVWLTPGSLWFTGAMAAPVLGHALGLLHHRHGGKCIAVSFGVLLALLPQDPVVLFLAIPYILFSTLIRIREHRIRSLIAFAAFGVGAFLWEWRCGVCTVAAGCVLIALIVMYRHKKPAEETLPVPTPDLSAEQ